MKHFVATSIIPHIFSPDSTMIKTKYHDITYDAFHSINMLFTSKVLNLLIFGQFSRYLNMENKFRYHSGTQVLWKGHSGKQTFYNKMSSIHFI